MPTPSSTRSESNLGGAHVLLLAFASLAPLPGLICFNPAFPGRPIHWIWCAAGLVLLALLVAFGAAIAGPDRAGKGLKRATLASRVWIAGGGAAGAWMALGTPGALLALASFALWLLPFPRGRAPGSWSAARRTVAAAWTMGGLVCGATLLALPLRAAPSVVVIGIDGATWSIIDDLRESGELPTFDALIRAGARGELLIRDPSISPSLWTTAATGVSPETHGVVDFWTSSTHVRAKRVWEIADEHGLSTGVLGYLVTWPPEKSGGFLVPGWLAQGVETVPPRLGFLKELEAMEHAIDMPGALDRAALVVRSVRHGATLSSVRDLVRVSTRQPGPGVDADRHDIERRIADTELAADVFCHLLRDFGPDLGIFYRHHVDAIEHLYFAHYQGTPRRGLRSEELERHADAIPSIYAATDRAIARIKSCTAQATSLIILSDHGQKLGGGAGTLLPMRHIKSTAVLESLDLLDVVRATNLGDQVFLRAADGGDLGPAIAALQGVVTASDGRPVFEIEVREDGGALLRLTPLIALDEPIRLGSDERPLSDVAKRSQRLSGTHTDRGILLLVGPGVAPARRLPDRTLVDVAPTILALLGLPLARDLEGTVVAEAFLDGASEELVTGFVDSYGLPDRAGAAPKPDLDRQTRDRLEALGYVQ